MIEFNGELTGECKRFLLRVQKRSEFIVSLIFTLLFGTPIACIAIFLYPFVALALLIFVYMFIASAISPSKKTRKLFMPKRIFVDLDEGTIVHQCEKMERFHMIDTVKTVIDYGDWYYLKFQYEDRDPYFACQKSLLTKGTLEEFEALFEGKIERCADKGSKKA